MAFRTQKISQMTPKGANLEATDLIEVSTIESGSYVTRSITGQEIIDAAVGNVDWGDIGGTLSAQTDLQSALDAKVPTSRTLTINGVTQDLSADRTFTISTGITIGSTAIASGTVGRILFEGAGNVVQESSSLFWDNTNVRLGVGTSSPSAIIHSVGSVTASGSIARGNFFNNALVASANNDVLVGLDIQPTFTNGAFTGLENIPLRFVSQSNSNVVKNILLKNIGTGNGTGVSIGFNNLNANNLSHAFIKSYYVTPSGMAMSFGTGGGSSLTSEGTTALVLNADQTANFTARVIANSGGFQATGTTTNLLMSDNGTPVITRNGSTGIQFLKDAYWQTFSIFTNNTENLRVASTGNVLINTTTDAGFRLDVNGTARVQGDLTLSTGILTTAGTTRLQGSLNYFTHNRLGSSGVFGFQIASLNNVASFWRWDGGTGDTEIGGNGYLGAGALKLYTNNAERMRIFYGGNVGINTTTDAGFRLDVNGTARVQGQFDVISGTANFRVNNNSTYVQLGIGSTAWVTYNANETYFQSTNIFFQNASNIIYSNGRAIFGSTSLNARAQLQIDSTTRGFLPPRMTTTQRNAIPFPPAGLQVYDTDLNRPCFYDGTTWITL